jgi:hypothetical protein
MDCLTLHEQYFSNRVGKKMALGRACMLTKLDCHSKMMMDRV